MAKHDQARTQASPRKQHKRLEREGIGEMREIKFRAFDKNKNRMIYGVEKIYDTIEPLFDEKGQEIDQADTSFFGYRSFGEMLDDEPDSLMQFTGLKDKNGKEIYEGDIVSFGQRHWHQSHEGHSDMRDHAGVVTYIAPEFYASIINPIEGFCDHSCPPLSESCEVIGNIYETPELLKQKVEA